MANKRRKRRNFTPEYKAEVVELVRTSGKSVGEIAHDLDLTETAVRDWVKRADQSRTTRPLARAYWGEGSLPGLSRSVRTR